jgi:hypothetical protein
MQGAVVDLITPLAAGLVAPAVLVVVEKAQVKMMAHQALLQEAPVQAAAVALVMKPAVD